MIRPRGLHLSTILGLAFWGRPPSRIEGPIRAFFCIADHYEPMVGVPPMSVEIERVDRWMRDYPRLCSGLEDSRGRPPQHTFFYPAEEHNPQHMDKLAGLVRQGLGDVEVHLHHDDDNAEALRNALEQYKRLLYEQHGLLRTDDRGEIIYGFVHGNWALNNSRPDGRWCGVNNELTVLRETGCYADFTLPSAPSPTQTRMINSIYYASDHPPRPKAHDDGIFARVGRPPPKDRLLIVQGPLAFDWGRRKMGVLPRLENADLHGGFPPTSNRMKLWLQAAVGVAGRPDWVFVKLHTHGAPERNAEMLLGEPMRQFHEALAGYARVHDNFQYYYVTAHEMAQLVHQAEDGATEPDFECWAVTDRSNQAKGT